MRIFEPSEFKSIVQIEDFWVTDEPMIDGASAIQLEEDLHNEALSPNKKTITKLLKAIEKYPQKTSFYNYLANAYRLLGNTKMYRETVKKTYAKFPNYEFGRVQMADVCVEENNLDNMAAYLGADFSLATFDSKQKVFHATLVRTYFYTLARYAILVKRPDLLQNAITVLSNDFLDFPRDFLKKYKASLLILQAMKRFEAEKEADKNKKTIQSFPTVRYETWEDAPVFQLDFTKKLYKTDQKTNPFTNLDGLDKDALIQDLIVVLKDTIHRYPFYEETVTEWKNMDAPINISAIFGVARNKHK